MSDVKPGDTVSINGPLDPAAAMYANIGYVVRLVTKPWGPCAVVRRPDQGYGETIPVKDLHLVSDATYQAWSTTSRQTMRAAAPPARTWAEAKSARDLARATAAMAVVERAVTAQAARRLPAEQDEPSELALFDLDTAA